MFIHKYFENKVKGEIESLKMNIKTKGLELFMNLSDSWEVVECFVKFSGNFGA